MIYLLKNDIYLEDSSSDNSVNITDSESSEEIEESTSVSSNDSEEITEVDSENSEEPAESSQEPAESSSEEPAESSSEESAVYYQTVSNTNISYNGITPPMFVDSMSICIFLLAVILGVALFGIFRSKL